MDREEQIRQRAHRMWEEEGRPEGRHAEHWARAAAELDGGGAAQDRPTSPGGIASSLQPGGTIPGGSPGAGLGSIGTGGGSTAGKASGNAAKTRP
jgi:hypothetical protein